MTYVIQRLSEENFQSRVDLAQFAFQFRLTPDDMVKQKQNELELGMANWGAFVQHKLAAQLSIYPLHVYIGGSSYKMGGIASVSTWPEYRRQGLVAGLLSRSLEEMRADGQTVSMLHPFSFSFYRKFGWETYTEYKKYTLKTSELPPKTAYEGRIQRLDGSLEQLSSIYEQYASRYNGMVVRSPAWWSIRVTRPLSELAAVYYNSAGDSSGYMIYVVKERKMTVKEFIALDEEAYTSMWSYIGQHDSMIDSVTVTMPCDDMLAYRLPNPRIAQELVPYCMARIVDAEAFIRQYGFAAADEQTELRIRIRDEHAAWNNGDYTLTIHSDGNGELAAIPEEHETIRHLTIDIGSLTALLLGYRKASELYAMNRIGGADSSAVAELERRIPQATTYLTDFF